MTQLYTCCGSVLAVLSFHEVFFSHDQLLLTRIDAFENLCISPETEKGLTKREGCHLLKPAHPAPNTLPHTNTGARRLDQEAGRGLGQCLFCAQGSPSLVASNNWVLRTTSCFLSVQRDSPIPTWPECPPCIPHTPSSSSPTRKSTCDL